MPQRRKGLCLSPGCLRELQKHSKIAKKSGDPETFVRIRGIVLVSEGYNYREVGQILDVTSGSVSNWVARYLDGGPRALATEARSGRPRKLSEEELCEFEEIINTGAMAYGFPNELWDAKRAARIILECFAVSYHPNHVAKILHQRGFSVQCPAVTLAKANREAQKHWENEDIPRIARRAKKKRAAIFFEDEISLSTQGTVHRTWARVGQRPQCPTQGRKRGVKVFGAISNQRQFRFRVQTVYFNQVTFTEFLNYFRDQVDGYVITIVDGASYHKGPLVKDFLWKHRKSFELEFLPAYSPEFNPQEDVWKTFRKNHTHNRCFMDTNDLLTATRSGFRSLQRSSALDGVFLECQNYFLQ